MAKVPLFFRDRQHRDDFIDRLKLIPCPHCRREGCLIRNGHLTGNDPQLQRDQRIERGQRFLCSKRFRRTGCGRSFSILQRGILRNFSLNAAIVSALLAACRKHLRVHPAWQTLTRHLSLSSAYRLWQRFGRQQDRLRQMLCQITGSPTSASSLPRLQTIDHLHKAFPQESSPIAAFQNHFQAPFFT